MRRSDPYDMYVCPEPTCRTKLALEDRFFTCGKCGRRYPIDEHGFPHLLISEGDKYRVQRDRE